MNMLRDCMGTLRTDVSMRICRLYFTAAVNFRAGEVSSSVLSLLIAGGVLTGTYPADLKLVCASTWLCMHQQQCQQAQ